MKFKKNIIEERKKKEIFKNYISTHFDTIHNKNNIIKEYKLMQKYFGMNYLPHLPNKKNVKILDIGCGMGHFLYFLKKQGFTNSIGVDISEEEIEFCKKFGFTVTKENIFFFLKNKKEIYDIIVLNDVIEHLTKNEIFKITAFIYAALKKGGKLFIKTKNMSNFITAGGGRYIDITHEVGFTEESLRQICKISHFNNIKIKGLNIYVFSWNPFNYLALFFSKILNLLMMFLNLLYGRKTTKIFTKDILAICTKY